MYSKVKKCLESMGYKFTEHDRVKFTNGLTLTNGFRVEKSYYDEVYIEINDNGVLQCGLLEIQESFVLFQSMKIM